MPARVMPRGESRSATTKAVSTPSQSQRASTSSLRRPQSVPKPSANSSLQTSNSVNTRSVKARATQKQCPVAKQKADNQDDPEPLLEVLSVPSLCTPESVQSLLFSLETTTESLGLNLLHTRRDVKSWAISSASSSTVKGPRPDANRAQDEPRDTFQRGTMFSKKVINAVITSLNDLVTSGWRPSTTSTASPTPSVASTQSSNAAKKSLATASRQSRSAVQPARALSATKVYILFDCFRVALRYLVRFAEAEMHDSPQNAQLNNIAISVIRKMIALELYEVAAHELDWMRNGRFRASFDIAHGSFYLSSNLRDQSASDVTLLLDVQTLSFSVALDRASFEDLPDILSSSADAAEGPLQSQLLARLRTDINAKDVDRCAYTAERAIMRCASRHAHWAFASRSASLRFLLSVSDLDHEAFWDRVVRVGVGHVRIATTKDEQRKAFNEADDLFRDLVRRKQQQEGDSDVAPTQSASFVKFCDIWTSLARKVGSVQALQFISDLTRQTKALGPHASEEFDVEARIVELVSTLTLADATLRSFDAGDASEEEGRTALERATADMEIALQLFSAASTESRERLLKEARHANRRCMALLEKLNDAPASLSIVRLSLKATGIIRLAICNLKATDEKRNMIEDYVCSKRFLAKTIFRTDEIGTHDQCYAALLASEKLLEEAKIDANGMERAEWLRLLSVSWHYAGAQLYAGKQAGLAIRFLEQAASTAAESCKIWRARQENAQSATEANEDAYQNQLAVLPKRWEHLGMSYRLAEQPSQAEYAYRKAVEAISHNTWDHIAKLSASMSIEQVFAERQSEDAAYTVYEAGRLVKTLFELHVFELLRIEKDETTVFDDLNRMGSANLALPSLAEHCLLALDSTLHRDEGPKACKLLLNIALSSYESSRLPLRRARVLLRSLEMLDETCSDNSSLWRLVEETEMLLLVDDLAGDVELMRFREQYSALLCMLKAQLASNLGTSANMAADIRKHLAEAIHALKRISPIEIRRVASDKKVIRRPLRHAAVPRQDKVVPATQVKTPIRKDPRELKDGKSFSPSASNNQAIDDVGRLISHLSIASELDVVHGSKDLSIDLLLVGRRIAQEHSRDDAYVSMSATLILQYASSYNLSKSKAVLTEVDDRIKQFTVGPDALARFKFARAELLCRLGKVNEAIGTYEEAVNLAQQTDKRARTNGMQGALQRILLVERQAMAFETFAKVHYVKGNLTAALHSCINGVKASMRGGTMLAKMSSRPSDNDDESDSPFILMLANTTQTSANQDDPAKAVSGVRKSKHTHFTNLALTALYWRMVKAMHHAYLHVSWLYCVRGSPKDAEAFLGECVDFAEKARTTAAHVSALVERGILYFRSNQQAKALEDVQTLTIVTAGRQEDDSATAALLALLQGEKGLHAQTHAEAVRQFQLSRGVKDKFSDEEPASELVWTPFCQVNLLRRTALAHHSTGDQDALKSILKMVSRLSCRTGETDLLQGKLALHDAIARLKHDQILSLVLDAAVSIPVAVDVESDAEGHLTRRHESEAAQSSLARLNHAAEMFAQVTTSAKTSCLSSIALRDAILQQAICQTLSSAILPDRKDVRDRTYDPACAAALEYELDEAIEIKIAPTRDNTGKSWPQFIMPTPKKAQDKPQRKASKLTSGISVKGSALSSADEIESSEAEREMDDRLTWTAARDRRLQRGELPNIPHNWTVVSIALARDRNCLLISRRKRAKQGVAEDEPVVFSIPIDRQSRREGDEEILSVDAALKELRDIVEESNTATHSAQGLDGLEARKAWWTRRRELDARMKALLKSIESTWLGAFRCALLPVSLHDEATPSSSLASLLTQLEDIILKACLPNAAARRSHGAHLNARVFDLFCSLDPATCSDEDLEDVVHFAMDALQCRGVNVAVDEIDLDTCVTDVRSAMEGYRSRKGRASKSTQGEEEAEEEDDDEHLILILDKEMSGIPWESLPCLRGKAICRMPSLAMMYDRLVTSPTGRREVSLSSAKLFYLVNPSQELIRTQERFLPYFLAKEERKEKLLQKRRTQWRGIAGRAPQMDEFARALETQDVVAYFGHGGAEQYVRGSRLRGMLRCAVTLLWGCSSGVLREMGEFERCGTPNNYMLAGSACLVGNLWDATDKELDGVSEQAMGLMGLIDDSSKGLQRGKGMSIAKAVAQSRDACKLPYLTGAACVVYGMPVYFT